MTDAGLTKGGWTTVGLAMRRMGRIGIIPVLSAGATSCINVTAPDKPIEINLNINVTQEVVYRLDGEAKSLIKQNPGIF